MSGQKLSEELSSLYFTYKEELFHDGMSHAFHEKLKKLLSVTPPHGGWGFVVSSTKKP